MDRLQWTEPREITERGLHEKTLPALRQMFRRFTRYALIMGLLVAVVYYLFDRDDYVALFFSLVSLAWFVYVIPLSIWVNTLQARKSGVKYWVDAKGVKVNQNLKTWKQVEGYSFSDYSLMPGIGSLNIKLRRREQWTCIPFPRCEVSEQDLRTMMERFALQDESTAA